MRFLVLSGDSCWGKTRFAVSLWGFRYTYIVQCQGAAQPNMNRYDPRKHKCVVLDEPSDELIDTCKVLMQAGVDGVDAYQSPTQRFTRWYCLYQVPIIICTNRWITDGTKGERADWIRENHVHVHVTDFMYELSAEERFTLLYKRLLNRSPDRGDGSRLL